MPWISSFRKSIPKLLGYANPIDSWTVKLSKWTKTFVTVQIVTIPLGWAVPIYLVISHIKLFPSSPVRLLLSITSWFTEDKINCVSTVIVTTVQKKNYKEKLNMKLLMDSPPTCPWNAELAKVNPHFIPLQTQQIPTRVALTTCFSTCLGWVLICPHGCILVKHRDSKRPDPSRLFHCGEFQLHNKRMKAKWRVTEARHPQQQVLYTVSQVSKYKIIHTSLILEFLTLLDNWSFQLIISFLESTIKHNFN